jgi:hypothetical protein
MSGKRVRRPDVLVLVLADIASMGVYTCVGLVAVGPTPT